MDWKKLKAPAIHGVVSVALFAIPYFLMQPAPWQDLTLGGLLNIVYHWLLVKYNS